MSGAAPGGAEFAAVELLDALVARGHEVVMLSDSPSIGRDTRVVVHPLDLGPKLSARTWPRLALRWPALRRRLARALEAELPYDVLLLHYKKEQLLAPGLPARLRPRVAWAEWGPVPMQMRSGPGRRLYAAASRGVAVVMAVSEGTRLSVIDAGVDPDKVTFLPNAHADRGNSLQRRGPSADPRRVGDPPRRLHGRLHLPLPPQEAQRRRDRRRANAGR